MSFRFRLIPRNEDFYLLFTALADELRVGGQLLEQMLASEPVIWDKVDEIKEAEHKCDHLTHQIIQRLNSTFVTPFDREDLYALATSLDDVMDAVDASARFIRLYKIKTITVGARELARRHLARASIKCAWPSKRWKRRRASPNERSRSTGWRTRPIAFMRAP